jgi:hypothetical protein
MKSVYCAVRTGSLNKAVFKGLIEIINTLYIYVSWTVGIENDT